MLRKIIWIMVIGYALGINASAFKPYKAVCIVPVADLVGQSVSDSLARIDAKPLYVSLAASAHSSNKMGCMRIHQLLFNEIVTVVDEKNDEVCIEISNAFVQKYLQQLPLNQFWTLKEYLLPLEYLKTYNVSIDLFPESISFAKNNIEYINKGITVTMSFYDSTTKKTYSAGTRFVPNLSATTAGYEAIFIFDPQQLLWFTTYIPKSIVYNPLKSQYARVQDFIALLRTWCHNQFGVVPYVWGGCSLLDIHSINQFSTTNYGTYIRPLLYHNSYTGFDASGLLLRAAQICHLPYYYKNSTTTALNLKPLSYFDTLEEGDLIWIPGGIAVISDYNRSLVISARGYEAGYGIVNELPLHEIFKNIYSCDDLVDAYYKQKPLKYLNAQGKVTKKYTQWALLKLKSMWK